MQDTNSSWKKLVSRSSGKDYWFNEITGESVWENPIKYDSLGRERESKRMKSDVSAEHSCTQSAQWTKNWSSSKNRDYWFNEIDGSTTWEDPTGSSSSSDRNSDELQSEKRPTEERAVSTVGTNVGKRSIHDFLSLIETERSLIAVRDRSCPRIRDRIDLKYLSAKIREERADRSRGADSIDTSAFQVVFSLPNDNTAMITRALQEDEILKTNLKARSKGEVVTLPSFWEVWRREDSLRDEILCSPDPNEAKWSCQRRFGYKLATTFMPGYARAIYEYFQAKVVLDPCAGWGDRMLGASIARHPSSSAEGVQRYVAFDPNRNLRPGYTDIMSLMGHSLTDATEDRLSFSNGFEVNSKPFEEGALSLPDDSFDFCFTSPPFFEYEMYNPNNPSYRDWIAEFYTPLMQHAARCVIPGRFVAIHIDDTSAGNIVEFLTDEVAKIAPLRMIFRIGLRGVKSDKVRNIWVFEKLHSKPRPTVTVGPSSSSSSLHTGIDPATLSRIRSLTNPPVKVAPFKDNITGRSYLLFDDGECLGGSKQRLLGSLLGQIGQKEVIYAGPDGGIAQVALAYTARIWRKKATVFLNTSSSSTKRKPPLVRLAEALGATIHLTDSSTRRTLAQTQEEAASYAAVDPENRALMPFGLKDGPGERNFEMLRSALMEAIPKRHLESPPERLWIVAGSAFLFSVLHSIWPGTKFMLVQVGKRVYPDQLEGKNAELFVSPEKFTHTAEMQPPYSTVPWYDAKLWQFVLDYGKEGDAIWNVGRVPDDPEKAAEIAIGQL